MGSGLVLLASIVNARLATFLLVWRPLKAAVGLLFQQLQLLPCMHKVVDVLGTRWQLDLSNGDALAYDVLHTQSLPLGSPPPSMK